jgi:anthranilate synthase
MFSSTDYVTQGGVHVARRVAEIPYPVSLPEIAQTLDHQRGVMLSSSYEVPGRYKRWSMAFVNPPIEVTTRGAAFTVTALNARGRVLLPAIREAIATVPGLVDFTASDTLLTGTVSPSDAVFDESERGRQNSIFTVLRAILALFHSKEDGQLGLFGAFGYDLVFQFDPMEHDKARPADQRDLVLFLPDELIAVDNRWERAFKLTYDFTVKGQATRDLPRDGQPVDPFGKRLKPEQPSELPQGGYAEIVRIAQEKFRVGDLFEVVPSQSFFEATEALPSTLFNILSAINPSPYGFLINLGGEYLVGASPEMFVRVAGGRVETCPISGTIKRGRDALEDAEQIRTLLNSAKDEAELTMCTDVDRNDKSRVCVPGSVQVIGRRQIEMYSHLIHTVDHVEGELAPGFDALDAFLSHMWAVTVTGAPKRAAIRFIEKHEVGARRWYGAAVGRLGFDGNMETGLTLRTMRVQDGIAEIRVGATLLSDSDPDEEERETVLKAAASKQTLKRAAELGAQVKPAAMAAPAPALPKRRVLVIDCEDSFVHTLAGYVRAANADVTVLRHNHAEAALAKGGWDLVLMSPGPGMPDEFNVPGLIRQAVARNLPVFGVCLGMQGIVEAFGGALDTMPAPQHGRAAPVAREGNASLLFDGLPERFTVGRYHSIHAVPDRLPPDLRVTARSSDGVIMAVEHVSLPVAGVQFHPESIMTGQDGTGQKIIDNVIRGLR